MSVTTPACYLETAEPVLRLLPAVLLFAACSRREAQATPPAAATPTGTLRPARFAGSWYPGDPAALTPLLDRDLGLARPLEGGDPVLAVVSPHAGIQFSGATAGTALGVLRGRPVRRVILVGPSHHLYYHGLALPPPEMTGYATPAGTLPIDRDAIGALRGAPGFGGPAAAHAPEHSLEMVAIFLARALPGVPIVPMVAGDLGDSGEVRAIAARLAATLRPSDVVVISSDFTHYGPNYDYIPFTTDVAENLQKYADEATLALAAADLAAFDAHLTATHDDICGREGLRLLMALLPPGARGERVAFDTSGRETGDYTNSVSYAGLVFRGKSPWGATGRH